jgi:hypothetical protein
MTTADWALVISILSALIALFSLGWNIWSKFIYPKPKVSVAFNYMDVIGGGALDGEHILTLNATNMGPIPVTLYSALVRTKRRWFLRAWFSRKRTYGLLNPLHNYPAQTNHTIGPFSGGLPKTLAVGEQFSIHLIPAHEELARDHYDRIGFNDTFGRMHWAPKRNVIRTRRSIRQECDRVGKSYD